MIDFVETVKLVMEHGVGLISASLETPMTLSWEGDVILFIKGTAEPLPALVEDEPDVMTVDYRKRCVVRVPGAFDRIIYGVAAAEYNGPQALLLLNPAKDIRDSFEHSAGCGRLPGQQKQKQQAVEIDL